MVTMRKTYEITGYVCTDTCIIICKNCYESNNPHEIIYDPIFLGDEWDYKPSCEWCNEEIEINLIEYTNEWDKIKAQIKKALKNDQSFKIGEYKRLYPDTLEETSGNFTIEITEFVYIEDFTLERIVFKILAIEGNLNLESLDLYESFNSYEEFNEFLEDLLNKFKSLEELFNFAYRKFNFLRKNDSLISAFNLVKEDLEDGTTFEDFFDRINDKTF